MSQLVRDAAAGLHLHTINKETHIWSWVGVFVAEYWALEFLQVFFTRIVLLDKPIKTEETSQLCLIHPHLTVEF